MGSKEAKSGKAGEAIFKLFSSGYKTGRDAYIYNSSRNVCAASARAMTGDYLGALRELGAVLKEWDKTEDSRPDMDAIVNDRRRATCLPCSVGP